MLKGMIAGLAMGAALWGADAARAQEDGERAWLQVEALPTLGRAQDAVRGYASQLPDVAGYHLGTGWYAVAIGPYAPEDAQAVLDRLMADGLVPGDAFLVDGTQFQQQFWPVGVGAATTAQPLPDLGAAPAPAPAAAPPAAAAPAPPAAPDPALPDETVAEAQAGEARLAPAEREQVQVALRWAGAYEGAIDGAFGRGTRAAMALWQSGNGYEPTGVLTARQRAALLAAYNGVLDELGLALVREEAAGIEMELPLGIVERAAVEPPFVRFEATDGSGAQVLLISQPGDVDRLWGLYEILQSLEAVPPEGPRERDEAGFVIEGIGPERRAHVEATLAEGTIKGFALIWPAGDEARRERLVQEMRASFRRLPGVLEPGPAVEEPEVDLVAGLRLRRPVAEASGFFVDGSGAVVTSAAAVASCEAVTIDEAHPARVAAADPATGLAVVVPEEALAPRSVATFRTTPPRVEAEVAVAGYPYGGALAQPALTWGRIEDLRGLGGEEEVRRLALVAQEGDAGGPVLDAGGAVLGMLLPRAEEGPVLPAEVSFALGAEAILAALAEAGITPATTAAPGEDLPPSRLVREAAGLAVLVSCW